MAEEGLHDLHDLGFQSDSTLLSCLNIERRRGKTDFPSLGHVHVGSNGHWLGGGLFWLSSLDHMHTLWLDLTAKREERHVDANYFSFSVQATG